MQKNIIGFKKLKLLRGEKKKNGRNKKEKKKEDSTELQKPAQRQRFITKKCD